MMVMTIMVAVLADSLFDSRRRVAWRPIWLPLLPGEDHRRASG
jgi:hypothetical protein